MPPLSPNSESNEITELSNKRRETEKLYKLATTWKDLIALNKRELNGELAGFPIPISTIESQPLMPHLLKLNSYGLYTFSSKVATIEQYSRTEARGQETFTITNQKAHVQFMLPTTHPSIPIGRIEQFCQTLLSHPSLAVILEPTERISPSSPLSSLLSTPGLNEMEESRSVSAPSLKEAESKWQSGPWERRTVLLPSRGYNVTASGVLAMRERVVELGGVEEDVRRVACKAAVEARPVVLYVTGRQYGLEKELWEVLEGLVVEAGLEELF
ncbi:hypothetical protein B0J11DRAFT_579577 [Dendryphion nanum]|uniref:Uncharacterized protein n=1 Tax=Dendryphion nanum TaxID=256645 RepID=A0A9P9DWR8_9PLEO|nr:hypothetical protein B0J11DRAFT_579577 [Dendryphion nanum]